MTVLSETRSLLNVMKCALDDQTHNMAPPQSDVHMFIVALTGA